MSRIGKKPVKLPAGVKASIKDHTITVEGKLGKLEWAFRDEVQVTLDDATKEVSVASG
jgi:large subunit ribosomal protein L6